MDVICKRIIEAERSIGPCYHDLMSVAIARAGNAMPDEGGADYQWYFAMSVRAHFSALCKTDALPEGWKSTGNPRLMGQIILANDELSLELRFLKERRTYPGGVPIAGRNMARREYYIGSEQLSLFEYGSVVLQPSPVKALLLWDYIDLANPKLGFTSRIAVTNGPGVFGQRVPLIASVDVRSEPPIGFEGLMFSGDQEEVDLFAEILPGENAERTGTI